MSDVEYTGQPAWRMKKLTLQMEVDVLGCCIVDGICSRLCGYMLTQWVDELIDIDEASSWVWLLLSV